MNEKEFSKQYWIDAAFEEIKKSKNISQEQWNTILKQEFYLSPFHHQDDLQDPLFANWSSFQREYNFPENFLWVNSVGREQSAIITPIMEECSSIDGFFVENDEDLLEIDLFRDYNLYGQSFTKWRLKNPFSFTVADQGDHFSRLKFILNQLIKGIGDQKDMICIYDLSQNFLLDMLSITTIQRLFECLKAYSKSKGLDVGSFRIIGKTVVEPVKTEERTVDNMIRNTIQVMMAFFTGLDAVVVKPHNFQFKEEDLWARRMGFFIPILLKEESVWHDDLKQAPFSGSPFLEKTSYELGKRLWETVFVKS